MKTKISILLCLAILLSCLSLFLSLSNMGVFEDFSKKGPVEDTDKNDQADLPSDEPSDEAVWRSVSLTDITNDDHGLSFGDDYPPASRIFKFTVEETGVYSVRRSEVSGNFLIVDSINNKMVCSDLDTLEFTVTLLPGEYAVGVQDDQTLEVYRYAGDFSEFTEDFLDLEMEMTGRMILGLDTYSVMKVICTDPVTLTEVNFSIGSPLGDSVSLEVYQNDGNGTLYFLLPESYCMVTLYVDSSAFGLNVEIEGVYGVNILFEQAEEGVDPAALDVAMFSMRSEALELVEDEMAMEEPEIVLWSDLNGQEIVECSDGCSFVDGVEVLWSDVIIVG